MTAQVLVSELAIHGPLGILNEARNDLPAESLAAAAAERPDGPGPPQCTSLFGLDRG